MKPEHWITLCNLLLTAVGLYLGPKIAVRRSLEQFRSQKWWERKASAYDDMIRSASRLCNFHVQCFDAVTIGPRLSDEWVARADEKNREAIGILETFKYSGGFVIVEEAGESVKRILNALDSPGSEEAHEYHDRASDVLLKEVKVLKECAARDLKTAG